MTDLQVRDLLASLREQRRHVLGAVAGLSDDELRRPALPSGWNCLGLVNHLALDVECFWFRAVLAGEPGARALLDASGDAWKVPDDEPSGAVLARYREQCAGADAVIARTAAGAAPAWWPDDRFGSWRLDTHRELLLHVIAETACHAGHLDAALELLDGRQWMVLH
ncbi:DUF664 domain-containing protein [Streptacidiphilus sp. N1-10]|uniref:DUF664 domain-containing protein n=1 Tax=Streptacidiphilus jeojiensis TaxID=3229225 RepID=A0ABV6XKQ3_9ACTN